MCQGLCKERLEVSVLIHVRLEYYKRNSVENRQRNNVIRDKIFSLEILRNGKIQVMLWERTCL
jgi:hypothetical protein